ncbi:MAG: hypothetical protein D6803_08130 [Anaerolineae bacterium]|nr:MAG: hypothetical protein D6803_08130 [Anaerolineae bacterium]
MNNPDVLPLILIAGIFAIFCLIGALLLFVFIWFGRRFVSIWNQSEKALQGEPDAYLAEKVSAMPDAPLTDYASLLSLAGQQILNKLHYRGALHRLADPRPEAPAPLAFDLQTVSGRGVLLARTASHRHELEIQRKGVLSPPVYRVHVDGIPILDIHLPFLKGQMPPLFQNLTLGLTREEEDWLIALAASLCYEPLVEH